MSDSCHSQITLTAKTPEQKSELNTLLGYLINTANGDKGFFDQIIPWDGIPDSKGSTKWGTQTDITLNDCKPEFSLSEDGKSTLSLTFNTYLGPCALIVDELRSWDLGVYAEFEYFYEGRRRRCVFDYGESV